MLGTNLRGAPPRAKGGAASDSYEGETEKEKESEALYPACEPSRLSTLRATPESACFVVRIDESSGSL